MKVSEVGVGIHFTLEEIEYLLSRLSEGSQRDEDREIFERLDDAKRFIIKRRLKK